MHAPKILSNIAPIVNLFQAMLLDAYGVFWGGNDFGLLPDSKSSMENLVAGGKIVGVLSNTTQLASKEIKKLHLHGLVLGQHYHFLTTSGEVARDIFYHEKLPFKTPKKKFYLFGGLHPKFSSHEAIFQGTPYSETHHIDEADFVYISIPHINGEDQTDPELFRNKLEDVKSKNLPMICPNPDHFAHEGNPPKLVVRQGGIAKMYEELGGYVFYIGKPYDHAYHYAMNCFQKHKIFNPSEILMIGDTPETDIRGARRFGMQSALVTQTGIMAERISHHGLESALKALSSQDSPDYYIARF